MTSLLEFEAVDGIAKGTAAKGTGEGVAEYIAGGAGVDEFETVFFVERLGSTVL